MNNLPPYKYEKTLKDVIKDILRAGYFTAIESRFHRGNLKQAITFASTDTRWFKIEFEESPERPIFTIGVGSERDEEPIGYIGFNLDKNGVVNGVGASEGINLNEWLEAFIDAKYDPERTNKLRLEYETVAENSVFHWQIEQRRRV